MAVNPKQINMIDVRSAIERLDSVRTLSDICPDKRRTGEEDLNGRV